MRYVLFTLLVVLAFSPGCNLLEPKIPIRAESMQITQNNNEILLTINFSGNELPQDAQASLLLIDDNGSLLFNDKFTLMQRDFTLGKHQIQKYLRINGSRPFAYADFTLKLVNQTFHAEQGKKPAALVAGLDMQLDAISHETQYTVHLTFLENGKIIKPEGIAELTILGKEGILYHNYRQISGDNFKEDYLTFFLPYSGVQKSFYGDGNLVVLFNGLERRIDIQLKKFNESEMLEQQDKDFVLAAKNMNFSIDYVNFRFSPTRTGYYFAHLPDKTKLVRFDVKLKNLLTRPQYLVRSDFYIKDSDDNFYPVYGTLSTRFGPLLKPMEELNASFYFNILAEKDSYSFYYGDKKMAEFKNSAN